MNPVNNLLHIEVAFADDYHQAVIPITVPSECTVLEAIQQSNILVQLPTLNQKDLCVGIFSRKVTYDTMVKNGDRVEIYSPLRMDPKDQRRQRAMHDKKVDEDLGVWSSKMCNEVD